MGIMKYTLAISKSNKPRTSISKPIPKPRSKISLIEDIEDIPPPPEFVDNNEEFEYNELPEVDQELYNVNKDGELIDFNLKDLFEPISVIPLEDETKTDMCNMVERYLLEGYCVDISGILMSSDGESVPHFSRGWANLNAFQSWRDNVHNIDSDEEEYLFTGVLRITKDNFSRLTRSKYGKGVDFRYDVEEYNGTYCYIPTSGNCFIKCVNKLLVKKISKQNYHLEML